MGKKQTRRTVSMSGATFARLQAHCQSRGLAMAAVVEDLIVKMLERSKPVAPTPAPENWRSPMDDF